MVLFQRWASLLVLGTYNYCWKYLFPLCNVGIYGDLIHKSGLPGSPGRRVSFLCALSGGIAGVTRRAIRDLYLLEIRGDSILFPLPGGVPESPGRRVSFLCLPKAKTPKERAPLIRRPSANLKYVRQRGRCGTRPFLQCKNWDSNSPRSSPL
jgi:hypothetical protein